MQLLPDTGSNLPPYDHKSNTKPLSYDEAMMKNSRSNSLLTSKCKLLFQMAKQSYPSLFTLTVGFVVCNLDCKPMFLVRNLHRQLVLSRDHFSNYLKQHDEKTLFCKLLY